MRRIAETKINHIYSYILLLVRIPRKIPLYLRTPQTPLHSVEIWSSVGVMTLLFPPPPSLGTSFTNSDCSTNISCPALAISPSSSRSTMLQHREEKTFESRHSRRHIHTRTLEVHDKDITHAIMYQAELSHNIEPIKYILCIHYVLLTLVTWNKCSQTT